MTRSYHNPKSITRSLNFLNTLFLAATAGILFLFNSCEDEGTIIGRNILPAADFVSIHSTDTLSVYSYTMFTDSLESDNPADVFLGQIHDPYFGTTTTGFVSQIRMNNTLPDDGAYVVDSVKLLLTFEDVSGNYAEGHILRMSEIAEEIFVDSIYYSSQQFSLTGFSVEVSLPELKADTVNSIYMNLPVSFGEYIVRDKSKLFYSESGEEPDFTSYFKGIYFQLISDGAPVFLTLNLEKTSTSYPYKHEFIIYLHDEESVQTTLSFILDPKSISNAAFNLFSHDLSTADPGKTIVHVNDGFKDTLTYVQCLNGIYTRLEIPGLDKIRNDPSLDGILINKARLTCPIHYDGSVYNGASFPYQLFMGYYDKLDNRYLIPDYFVSASFFDGVIDTAAANYTFNIARYIQRYLDDTTAYYKPEFQLALPEGSLRNAILKANGSADPVKFELVYTRF